MEFANVNFIQPLPSKVISPEIETAMKELVEKYCPVRQGTARRETTKALPPAVYTQQHNYNKEDLMAGLANDPYTEYRVAFTKEEEGEFVQATSEGGGVTEVDDSLVAVAVAEAQPPQDEYETDSEDDFSDTDGEDFAPIAVSRPGRRIRLDL